jgi:hypothetical protein
MCTMEYFLSFFGYNNQTVYPQLEGLTKAIAIESPALYNYKEGMPTIISHNLAQKISSKAGQVAFGKKVRFTFPHGPDNDGLNNCQLKLYFEENLPIGFEPKDVIRTIELEIAGNRIDRIYSHQLEPMLARLKHNWTVKTNCLTIPLPFDLLSNHNYIPIGELMSDSAPQYSSSNINILIEFQQCHSDLQIQEGYLEADYFKLAQRPHTNQHRKNLTHTYRTQFCGDESFPLHPEIYRIRFRGEERFPVNPETYRTRVYFDDNVRWLWFYFTDDNNNLIPLEFDQIQLQFDGQTRFESKHTQLVTVARECFTEKIANKGYYCINLCDQDLDTPISKQKQIDFSRFDRIFLILTGYKTEANNLRISICGLSDDIITNQEGLTYLNRWF